MRLHPAVEEAEALEWLRGQVIARWGLDVLPEMETSLQGLAQSMAAVSAVELPDEIEPHLL